MALSIFNLSGLSAPSTAGVLLETNGGGRGGYLIRLLRLRQELRLWLGLARATKWFRRPVDIFETNSHFYNIPRLQIWCQIVVAASMNTSAGYECAASKPMCASRPSSTTSEHGV